MSDNLVFVVGFPRSGTTYLQSLLCTQQNVVSLPETHFFSNILKELEWDNDKNLNDESFVTLNRLLEKWLDHKLTSSELDALKKRVDRQTIFRTVLKSYFSKHGIRCTENHLVLEKTPSHIHHLYEILDIFPQAKFLVIFRDPIKTINSHYEKLLAYRQPYMELAKRWRNSYVKALDFEKDFPNHVLFIKYEDLLNERVKGMDIICDFLNIELKANLLNNFSEEAKKIILPSEVWKIQNTKNTNTKSAIHIPIFKRVMIFCYVIRGLVKLNVLKCFGRFI